MPTLVSRKGWGARAPRTRHTVAWSVRTEFFVHHTESPTSQSIKSIQAFHLDVRGWGDIGYNWLVDDNGTIYEGRGWLVVGAHCPNHNRTGESVAYIGKNDPTPEALRSIRWLYDEACRRTGKRLKMLGHGQKFATACPGPKLQAWVNDGMPVDPAEKPPAKPQPAKPPETAPAGLPVLRPGDDSWDVKTVRWLLGARGFPPEDLTSKVFDEELDIFVKAFQANRKLDADGIVGEKTWQALLRL